MARTSYTLPLKLRKDWAERQSGKHGHTPTERRLLDAMVYFGMRGFVENKTQAAFAKWAVVSRKSAERAFPLFQKQGLITIKTSNKSQNAYTYELHYDVISDNSSIRTNDGFNSDISESHFGQMSEPIRTNDACSESYNLEERDIEGDGEERDQKLAHHAAADVGGEGTDLCSAGEGASAPFETPPNDELMAESTGPSPALPPVAYCSWRNCGRAFYRTRSDKQYCSRACKEYAAQSQRLLRERLARSA